MASVGLPLSNEKEIVDKFCIGINKKTRLIVVDHVASVSGVVFPVKSIAKKAQEKNIPVLVDVPMPLECLILMSPRWVWIGMLATAINGYAHLKVPHLFGREKINKLIFTPQRFLMTWAKVLPLNLIKLVPEMPHHGYVPSAIEFHKKIGGAGIRRRNHEVVVSAACRLAALWQTELGAAPNLFGSLATIRIPNKLDPTRESADHIKNGWEGKACRGPCNAIL